MRFLPLLFAVLLAVSSAACGKKSAKGQPGDPSSQDGTEDDGEDGEDADDALLNLPDPVPAELSPDEPSTELGDYPTALELEAEAERTVSPENLEAELDRLEAEIAGYPG